MGIGDILTLAFFAFLWVAPPIALVFQIRSGEIRWGHGFGFPQAKRSVNPGMFWTLVAFEAIAMSAADLMMIIMAARGR